MLTKRSQQYISIIFQQGTFLRIIPFKWNVKEKRLIVVTGSSLIVPILIVTIVWINLIFMIWSYHHVRYSPKLTASTRSFHFLFIVTSLVASIFGYNNIKKRNEYADFLSNFLRFLSQLEDDFLPKNFTSKINICELMILSFVFLTWIQSFALSCIFLHQPSSPQYLYSYLFDSYSSFWLWITYAICEFTLYVSYMFITLTNVVTAFAYWYGSTYWLKEMRIHGTKISTETATKPMNETEEKLRSINTSLSVYVRMRVINNSFRLFMSPIIMSCSQYLIIILPATCNFILIRYHQYLNIFAFGTSLILSLSCMAICIFAYPVAASIFSLSVTYLNAYKKFHIAPNLSIIQKKRIRAFKPLTVQVGSWFFIKKFMVLKLINGIIYWTMRSLLIFKK